MASAMRGQQVVSPRPQPRANPGSPPPQPETSAEQPAEINRTRLRVEWLDSKRRTYECESWETASTNGDALILHFADHAVLLPLASVRQITFDKGERDETA